MQRVLLHYYMYLFSNNNETKTSYKAYLGGKAWS